MHLDIKPIRHKQRIYIGGNSGASELFELTRSVLKQIGKAVDFYVIGEDPAFTDAPVVVIRGGDQLTGGQALFHQLDVHILLIHKITEEYPAGYENFEAYVSQYEQLADNLPKAGTYFFFEGDDVATLIGKKEREDVKNMEYSALTMEDLQGVKNASDPVFRELAGGAKALLSRLGVSQDQFFEGLKAL